VRWQGGELFKSAVYTQSIAAPHFKKFDNAASVQINTIRGAHMGLKRNLWISASVIFLELSIRKREIVKM